MDLFTKIDHVNYATEDAFPYGADVRILDPSAGKGAEAAQQDALEAAAVSLLAFKGPCLPVQIHNFLAQQQSLRRALIVCWIQGGLGELCLLSSRMAPSF